MPRTCTFHCLTRVLTLWHWQVWASKWSPFKWKVWYFLHDQTNVNRCWETPETNWPLSTPGTSLKDPSHYPGPDSHIHLLTISYTRDDSQDLLVEPVYLKYWQKRHWAKFWAESCTSVPSSELISLIIFKPIHSAHIWQPCFWAIPTTTDYLRFSCPLCEMSLECSAPLSIKT
jgi:hypothetical protein